MKRSLRFTLFVLTLLAAACDQSQPLGTWSGPEMLSQVSIQDIPNAPPQVKILRTPHYKIFTTIDDRPDLNARIAQLMEGALSAYTKVAGNLPTTNYPMQCYLFDDRVEWERFTRQHAGPDADIYLKIARGGYTIHDWYVAYYIGDIGTYSVAAHEGWHQYVNRHFKGRLPPFLEEGIACMFEDVEWSGDLPRWNLSLNPSRALSLRRAMDAGQLFPLDKLITLHAGQIVNMSGIRIEAFYAQDWAFARYLWEGENGKYRPALQRLIADTAAGTVFDPTGSHRRSYLPWNPRGVRPMLEHYLGEDLSVTETGFKQFMAKVAYDEMKQQFEM
ncbi:MAG: hypothetical protein ABSF29_01825 [Tepidisphaeraceae bacterium]|jgi:hypothetical protein